MKTTVEKFIEDMEIGTGKPFPEELKSGWRQMELAEILRAWETGNEAGWSCKTDDASGFMEKYSESLGDIKDKQ